MVRIRARCCNGWLGLPIVLVLPFVACHMESGDGGAVPDSYDVFIDSTSTAVASTHVELFGLASCDVCPPDDVAFGGCPPVRGPFESEIDVQWSNHSTGDRGGALHFVSGHCACLFSTCWVSYSHRWSATVPLVMGPNVIEVGAFGPAREPGLDTVTITRTPAAPAGVDARGGDGGIELRWEPVAEATSYNLYWSETSDLSSATASQVRGAVSPFQHGGLADERTIYYAVTAVSGIQEGPLSQVVWATAGWRTEVLPAPAGEGSWVYADTSIATDSLDHVHIHHSRREPSGMGVQQQNYHVTDSAGPWVSLPVALTAWTDAEIATDSRGNVHLSYLGLDGPTHAAESAGTWSSEVVGALGPCDSSLALDPLDRVHLAFRGGGVRYASNASGAWLVQIVDPGDPGCDQDISRLSLAVEGDGSAHVLYSGAAPSHGLQYATNQGGSWAFSMIAPGYIEGLSLAVDAEGTAHAAFVDGQSVLRHARREASGAWTVEQIDDALTLHTPALALDVFGHCHVSYFLSSGGGELRYATNSGGEWRVVRVDAAEYSETALTVDLHGRIHISYFAGGNPRYATHR